MLIHYSNFTLVSIDVKRVNSLVSLVNECDERHVQIQSVQFYQNGFLVKFRGLAGDAILHDGSYGQEIGLWETCGFPWDYGDVSTHTPKELAELLHELADAAANTETKKNE